MCWQRVKLTTRITAPAFSVIVLYPQAWMREIGKNKITKVAVDHSAGQFRSIYHPTNQPHPNPIVNARQLTRSIPHKQAFLTPFTPLPPTRASICARTYSAHCSLNQTNSRIPSFPSLQHRRGMGTVFFFSFFLLLFPPPFSYRTYLLRSWNPPPLSSYSNSCSRYVVAQ